MNGLKVLNLSYLKIVKFPELDFKSHFRSLGK